MTKPIESWPFIWGKGSPQEMKLNEHSHYWFPEDSAVAPYLGQDPGAAYFSDPNKLGVEDVYMTGRDFIDTLRERQSDIPDIGGWTLTGYMQDGYDAYLAGKTFVDSCFHPCTIPDREWQTGWLIAQQDHPTEGYNKENE